MMVSKGFLKAGYEYIIVDDCWLSHERDHNGELQPDPERFPSGMKALGDYVSYRISYTASRGRYLTTFSGSWTWP